MHRKPLTHDMRISFKHLFYFISTYVYSSVSSTLSAFVTVVYNDSSGQVPDLLNLGTTLSPTWTLVDKQSSEGVNKSVSCHFRQKMFSIQSNMIK